jgi:uroporphyrinogen decarboxylase
MNDLFLRACRREPVERTPLWIMRQAGRYLPEYRKVREAVDFLTLCRTPELAVQVTLQPIERFGLDAAILFSDIMTPLESLGVRLDFRPGPVVAEPLRDRGAVEALQIPEEGEIAPFAVEAVRLLAAELEGRVPLIGFAGAPLTLAAYLVEGQGSKSFPRLRALLHGEPSTARLLLDRLAEMTIRYLRAQIQAGAKAVQLFDTWAGLLSEREYRRFALPPVRRIMGALAGLGAERIYFAPEASAFLPALGEVQAEMQGVGWRSGLRQAREALGEGYALQGNLDPAVLLTRPEIVEAEVKRILEEAGPLGHVFNLGHGILPETPIENVEALVRAVREGSARETKP